MTQREDFEAWKKINNALGYGLSRNNAPDSNLDGYEDAYTQGQWVAWRAAQAAQSARAPLSADAYEALVDDLGEWSRHVAEDTAHITLDTHIRRTLAAHGIKQGGQQ